MAGKQSAAQQRAEIAEETQDYWERQVWADGVCDARERAEMSRRLRLIVTGAGEQALEIAYVVAWLTGGLPAQRNEDSRVRRLQREARRNGEDWTCPDDFDPPPAAAALPDAA